MQKRRLGRTGLEVSEIGYGAWGIGGAMWIGADDRESLRALNRASTSVAALRPETFECRFVSLLPLRRCPGPCQLDLFIDDPGEALVRLCP